ncbi:bifunctional DNA-formamidopyrimidine glycosylase/DNA-(apurinic or apyrimidinic site) lyase [Geobacter pelophilus]|uniref:Formamidopyrimidine-DNA glycosylase n=1 Tax=Geoanaerobacter pelophilus TaxID=60036 RepID=A0AAW4L7X6_9BACT|nr:bifunctional DNA-formamidopyrimidine glycosylase/DNA-(apurinic or apyrimidinic site) lyase [Geoanaerobacter pelophilus]MBT0664401.1 bifunctional DNA-formamidopyrimidine glycosylase/DNA-(apurinic or apyrimidinic site) lyase [Geoanaerobacter pelophilus]
MPELPEVEVTRLRLGRELVGKQIMQVVIRAAKLRLPIPSDLKEVLPGRVLTSVVRRGKYLLFFCDGGCLIIHLGMTGFLQLLAVETKAGKHDHLDIVFSDNSVLRFHDPRKFGTVIWTTEDPAGHPLLATIGPEPLTTLFDGTYLFTVSRSRTVAVKQMIMNSAVVAGVGNIYANEALFRAGILPSRLACSLTLMECERLVAAIRDVLTESIDSGSTFTVTEGLVSYHPLVFNVYGRSGELCPVCGATLESSRLGNRSTVFCSRCQR